MSKEWERAAEITGWLNERNGTGQKEVLLRVLKILEEAGEVAQAVSGSRGQNPRKGFTHTEEDVAYELCDVILTAMVALHSFTHEPEKLFGHVVKHRHKRLSDVLEYDV